MNFRVTGKTVEMFPEMLVAFGTDLENQFFLKDGLSCLTLFKSSKIMIVFKRMHHKNILNISCKNRFVLRLVKYKESHSITCLIVSVNCCSLLNICACRSSILSSFNKPLHVLYVR